METGSPDLPPEVERTLNRDVTIRLVLAGLGLVLALCVVGFFGLRAWTR